MKIALIVFGVVAAIALLVLLVRAVVNSADKWELVDEGNFDHIEYGRFHQVIYFEDGRTRLMRDWRASMSHPKGTKLKISRNGVGEYRIDKV